MRTDGGFPCIYSLYFFLLLLGILDVILTLLLGLHGAWPQFSSKLHISAHPGLVPLYARMVAFCGTTGGHTPGSACGCGCALHPPPRPRDERDALASLLASSAVKWVIIGEDV